jgi:hypothetical protein
MIIRASELRWYGGPPAPTGPAAITVTVTVTIGFEDGAES